MISNKAAGSCDQNLGSCHAFTPFSVESGISFLDSQAVGIVHPVASFGVNLALLPIWVVPRGRCNA
jgi:hypothetical protein